MRKQLACILLICTACMAQAQKSSRDTFSPYKLNTVADISALAGGAALFGVGHHLTSNITPLTTAEVSSLDMLEISAVDRSATERFVQGDAVISDFVLAGAAVAPLALAFDKRIRQDYLTIGVMFSEVILINSGVTNIFKGSFQRNRPYVYNPLVPMEEKTDRGARESFFSGHVSHTAAYSFFAAHVINQYSDNQTVKTAAWIGAFTLPAVVGYLRYSSGKHYPSDILTGYVVGAAIGYFVPQLHLNKPGNNLNLTAGAGHFSLTYTFR